MVTAIASVAALCRLSVLRIGATEGMHEKVATPPHIYFADIEERASKKLFRVLGSSAVLVVGEGFETPGWARSECYGDKGIITPPLTIDC